MKVLNFNDPYVDRKGDVNNLGDVLTDTIYDDTEVKESIAKLNSNLSKMDMQLRNYNNEVNISPEMKEAIESSFTSTSDYSIFSGSSNTQEEGCWYGYKHTNTMDCYFTFYTQRLGILAGKRSSNGSYSFRYLSEKW